MSIVPLSQYGQRIKQAGRIRLGEQGARGPKALAKFRFTAPDRESLDTLAELYGGVVRPWNEKASDDAFELYSEASEINVVLVPDCLDMNYELWGSGGNQRRCDGITCTLQVPGEEGPEPREVPCVCENEGALACKLKLRLQVILPEVRFFGVWRLDSSSDYAARELPGMVATIVQLNNGTELVRARLGVEKRHRVVMTSKGARRKNFNVPVLGFAASLDEIARGEARVSIGPGTVPPGPLGGPLALVRGTPTHHVPPDAEGKYGQDFDDEVIEAEVVGEDDDLAEWAALLSSRERSRALSEARRMAAEDGAPAPVSFDAIGHGHLERIWVAWKEQ